MEQSESYVVKSRPCKTFYKRLYCKHCDEEMQYSRILLTDPPIFEYKCPKCGNTVNTRDKYPTLAIIEE